MKKSEHFSPKGSMQSGTSGYQNLRPRQVPSPPFIPSHNGMTNMAPMVPGYLPSPPFPQQQGKKSLPFPSAYGTMPMPTGASAASPISGTLPQTMDSTGSSMPMAVSGQTPGTLPVLTDEQPPTTMTSTLYTPGFLRTQIGKNVRVEFLIGTNQLVDRFGTLVGVGASYILINEAESDDLLLCDIYSIKFVKFYY